MKKQTLAVVLIVFFAVCFVGLSIFFAARNISVSDKKWEYFETYKTQAEEYIKELPEITEKYGDTVSVKFDDSITYSESDPKSYFERCVELFNPLAPDSLEEFNENIDMIKFKATVNGDEYEITYEKNSSGEFFISSLTPIGD